MAGRKASKAAALLAVLIVAAVAATAGALTMCNVDSSAVDECKPYCMKGSTEATPSQLCCDMVKQADWKCLCRFKSKLSNDIDGKRVVDLAKKCQTDNQPPASCYQYSKMIFP